MFTYCATTLRLDVREELLLLCNEMEGVGKSKQTLPMAEWRNVVKTSHDFPQIFTHFPLYKHKHT